MLTHSNLTFGVTGTVPGGGPHRDTSLPFAAE